MKQYVLVTKSESGDDYIYFITSEKKPTNKEIKNFLMKNGNDVEGDTCYENVERLEEITNFIPLK